MARILFTSKMGGVSSGSYRSLNLSLQVGDDPKSVLRNRDFLMTEFSSENMVYMNQVHGSVLVEVSKGSLVLAEGSQKAIPNADALITRDRNLALVVQVADCIPILIRSEFQVAALHVGRRGLVAGLIEKVISNFRSNGEVNIKADLGPSICVNCYEVDLPTYHSVVEVAPATATSVKRHHLDLAKGATSILEASNISVHNWGVCTQENLDYFSFRRDSQTGRQVGVISL